MLIDHSTNFGRSTLTFFLFFVIFVFAFLSKPQLNLNFYSLVVRLKGLSGG